MVKCSECGYENIEGLDYCDSCGAKLESGGATAAPHEHQAEAPAEHPQEAAQPAPPPAAPAQPVAAPEPATSTEAAQPQAAAAEPAPAAAPAAIRPKLTITRGGRKGQEFPLENGNNLVGRWDPETGAFPEVDLDQDDPEAKISRKHALIRVEGGKITIEDIGSLNGTFVNRQPRLQPGSPVELKSGDEVIVGKTFLRLTIEPAS
ncbi:MAG: FHA domain-containing protein [Deltaproteobacteria bacterium]|jgi:pSer/pThr/pTyr-binding forkhead associated (FHA) protein|nr:FHA domain-containing protein [Deltaproteobacteria bacterium]